MLESHAEYVQILHLGSGTCSEIDDIDLNILAAECRRWSYFMDEDYHDELLEKYYISDGDTDDGYTDDDEEDDVDDEDDDGDVYPYMCPTCGAAMPKLSSLFQHIESPCCEQTLNDGAIGTLRRFLSSRLNVKSA